MTVLSFCLSVIGATIIVFALKSIKKEYAVLASVILGILILTQVIKEMTPFFTYISSLASESESKKYFTVLLKSFLIAFICLITANICRDMEENSLALKVELFGKAAILTLSIPLIKDILDFSQNLIS